MHDVTHTNDISKYNASNMKNKIILKMKNEKFICFGLRNQNVESNTKKKDAILYYKKIIKNSYSI